MGLRKANFSIHMNLTGFRQPSPPKSDPKGPSFSQSTYTAPPRPAAAPGMCSHCTGAPQVEEPCTAVTDPLEADVKRQQLYILGGACTEHFVGTFIIYTQHSPVTQWPTENGLDVFVKVSMSKQFASFVCVCVCR